MSSAAPSPPAQWPDALYELLRRHDVTQFAYVPDAGHRVLIDRSLADPAVRSIVLTTEEEGVAMLAGADLGGVRGVLLVQSSGVGNCINMLSLIQECRFPLFSVVTMRGQFGEFNPWQVPMGESTARALANAGVLVKEVDDAARVVETVTASLTLAFSTYRSVAVLISQRIIGYKVWK